MIYKNIFDPSPESFFSKKENQIAVLIFALLWVYLFLRGIYLPIMHDEVATFYFYIQSGVIFPPEAHYDANNHVLNSLLSHWSYQLFGSSPLAIRLPNVLAFFLFFFSIKNIASRIEHIIYRWGFLLAVSMSYFIFEYFSETRGYGLAMAFLVAAIFQYFKLTETSKTKHLIFCALLLFLATFANLTSLVSSVLLFMLMALHTFLSDYKTNTKRLWYKLGALLLIGAPFLIFVQWSFKLKELGLLYYGSLEGFYAVTVRTLFDNFVGSYHIWEGVLVTLIFAFVIAQLIHFLKKEKQLLQLISGKNVLGLLLIGSVIMINLMAWLLEVNFPEDRAGIYLFIYITGAFSFAISFYAKTIKWLSVFVIFLAYFPISFIATASLRQATFWIDSRNSQPIFDQVTQLESDFKFPLIVGGYATQELVWYYMNHQTGGDHGRLHWSNHPGIDADVELVAPHRMENPLIYEYYDSIDYDPAADLIYFKRKNRLPKILLDEYKFDDIENTNQEYLTLYKTKADSLINKTIYVGTECTLDAAAKPFRSRLVAVAESEGNPNMAYEYVQLDWLKKSWSGEPNNLLQGSLIHNVPKGATDIVLYLWNPDTTTFSIRDGKCYLYLLDRDF